jgi:hypothetical protein
LNIKEYVSYTDQGSIAFAYLAGVHYNNCMVGKMKFWEVVIESLFLMLGGKSRLAC